LFNKHGGHETVNFNLFSTDLPDTPGPDIGFELHSQRGFVRVSFPVRRALRRQNHRADLRWASDGEKTWRGDLTANNEPLLIGAEPMTTRHIGLSPAKCKALRCGREYSQMPNSRS
jgi:hypothetical protein